LVQGVRKRKGEKILNKKLGGEGADSKKKRKKEKDERVSHLLPDNAKRGKIASVGG